MSEKLKIGLIGCGDFGASLGRYFLEDCTIPAICDVNEASARKTSEALGCDPAIYTDYRKMFAQESLDAVAVTASNFMHAEITIAAAQAGLHVFCEKAMARTVQECWAMVRACETSQVRLMVGHKRRLRPSWSRMLALTDNAALGRPLIATVTQYADMRPYRYPGTWWANSELSGGSYAVLGVHVIDWLAAMFGPVTQVSAVNGPCIDSGYLYPTLQHATLRYESGGVASLNTSFHYPLRKFREAQGPTVQCEYGGMELVPKMDHSDLYYQRLDDDESHHERFEVVHDYEPAYRKEVSDFLQWVRGKIESPCMTWREGLSCVETMQALYQSANNNGAWVNLPLMPPEIAWVKA